MLLSSWFLGQLLQFSPCCRFVSQFLHKVFKILKNMVQNILHIKLLLLENSITIKYPGVQDLTSYNYFVALTTSRCIFEAFIVLLISASVLFLPLLTFNAFPLDPAPVRLLLSWYCVLYYTPHQYTNEFTILLKHFVVAYWSYIP